MSKIQGVLVDPVAMRVSDVEVTADNIGEIYALCDYDCFDIARVTVRLARRGSAQLSIFVDDEGLLKPGRSYFGVLSAILAPPTSVTQLANRALILGPPDSEGRTQACPLSADTLRPYLHFYMRDDDQDGAIFFCPADRVEAERNRGIDAPPPFVDDRQLDLSFRVERIAPGDVRITQQLRKSPT